VAAGNNVLEHGSTVACTGDGQRIIARPGPAHGGSIGGTRLEKPQASVAFWFRLGVVTGQVKIRTALF
jgi:hypothetical protein